MEGGSTDAWRDQDSEVYMRAFPKTVYTSRAALAQRRPASAFMLDCDCQVSHQVNSRLIDAVTKVR